MADFESFNPENTHASTGDVIERRGSHRAKPDHDNIESLHSE
jgi:hypothetical protein